uniref:Bm13099 n=1 Tax=Brugia malayi TaxID=6279 RepID=A0A0J9XU17_BRUMA|nr:Bm13099 [Brugia malayi]
MAGSSIYIWLRTEVQGDGATVAMEIKWCHYLRSDRVERLQPIRNPTEATTTRHTHLCLAQFQNTSPFSQRSNFTTENNIISLEDDLVQSILQWSCDLGMSWFYSFLSSLFKKLP